MLIQFYIILIATEGSKMLILKGKHAFSSFRLQQKLTNLKQVSTQLTNISANKVFFIDETQELAENEQALLQQILPVASSPDLDLKHKDYVLVLPRVGTISPWSSKASEIIVNCGLENVARAERGILYEFEFSATTTISKIKLEELAAVLHDPMTQSLCFDIQEAQELFLHPQPKPLQTVSVLAEGIVALEEINSRLGLAMDNVEMEYLLNHYQSIQRDPSDAELMMFAQANSEHCRHKIFNCSWVINGKEQDKSLFAMIRNTFTTHPNNILVAYVDNGSVVEGSVGERFFVTPENQVYQFSNEAIHMVTKVETHNHPTAIAPFPGAATGAGGEIRDEGATGRGAKPKAGLCGFSVSNLHLPKLAKAWETPYGKPAHVASSLDIMLDAPIGAAAFNNEFGRANLCGYFRSFELTVNGRVWGYHKPIMIAGGLGNIRDHHVEKEPLPVATPLIVLGGPAMLIGLGGSAASSKSSGSGAQHLDFASVQRGNPEMQRRAQQVIDACWEMGDDNPILSIHDVGAGGLSNAIPEIIEAANQGGIIELRKVPNAELGMTPMEIWCNEAQERYVLAIDKNKLKQFLGMAKRERAIVAVVGETTAEEQLRVTDDIFNNAPIDMPLSVLLGNTPKLERRVTREEVTLQKFMTQDIELGDAVQRVLALPTVASKNFLITIGDRSIGGLTARDQMVGPWQVPVADVAVTASSFTGYSGEAMAMGERPPIALINPQASARMAVAEAITNIAAAKIDSLANISLSANWMADCRDEQQAIALFDAVKAIGMELCPDLGINIPVGKDSLSMRMMWQDDNETKQVTAPLSLILSAFAHVSDIRKTWTPQLSVDQGATELLLIDLSQGQQRLGGSALAQVYQQLGDEAPDVVAASVLKNFFLAMQALHDDNSVLAYHDRSDGGLMTTLCEMAFAGHCGVTIDLPNMAATIAQLFNEELGAVLQIKQQDKDSVLAVLKQYNLIDCCHSIGTTNTTDKIEISHQNEQVFSQSRSELQRIWAETSYHIQALRDNPETAQQEFAAIQQPDTGLFVKLSFDIEENVAAPFIKAGVRPKVAILREQGVNGQTEMAAAFHLAGFECHDVHMQDLLEGNIKLNSFVGLVACGGFSYGDVLGAGQGWAKTILFHNNLADQFAEFFQNPNTFSLGVCNGCQMLSQLKSMIPGSEAWPIFLDNNSGQFEARLVQVEVCDSPSIFLQNMQGSQMPIVVAHGEGRAVWENAVQQQAMPANTIAMRYIDHNGKTTEIYPHNPNGSPEGVTGLTTTDGRVTIMMPHPERVFRASQFSWHPDDWQERSPWLRMFENARLWIN